MTMSNSVVGAGHEAVAYLPIFGSGSTTEVYQIRQENAEHPAVEAETKDHVQKWEEQKSKADIGS